jgi:hypothetical protein
MAELADALDLGSNAQKACRFKSCSRHQPPQYLQRTVILSGVASLLRKDAPQSKDPYKLYAV